MNESTPPAEITAEDILSMGRDAAIAALVAGARLSKPAAPVQSVDTFDSVVKAHRSRIIEREKAFNDHTGRSNVDD